MKSVSAGLTTAITTDGIQFPICKVELYKTPFASPSYGINVVTWRENIDPSTDTPVVGSPIDGSYSVLTDTDVKVVSHLRNQWGSGRPYGYDNKQDMLVRYEGYFNATSTSVDFRVFASTSADFYIDSGSSSYPSALTTGERVVQHVAPLFFQDNYTDGTATVSVGWNTFRLDHTMKAGAFGSVVVLWKNTADSDWKVLDVGVANVAASAPTPVTLSGVLSVQGTETAGRVSNVSIAIAKESSTDYDYDSTTDAYGVLRPNRLLKVSAGFNTQGRGSTPDSTDYVEMGWFHIDKVALSRADGNDTFLVTARDARKKLEDSVNLGYPNFISYDIAGYNSDTVFSEPDGKQRYTAYDSWTLAEAVRDLCQQAGLTSSQLWATDGAGNYKIEENSVRLNRGALYRLKLPNEAQELKYELPVGEKLLSLVNSLVEDYGYEWGIDYEGEVYLREANNPTAVRVSDFDSVPASETTTESPYAFAGLYSTTTTATEYWEHNPSFNYKGYDLIIECVDASGIVSITRGGGAVSGFTNYDLAYDKAWSFRDGIDPDTNTNPCVIEVERGITSNSDAVRVTYASGDVRIAGIQFYTDDRDAVDVTFTESRITRLNVENTDENIRNDVIVAGAEKGIDLEETLVYSRSTDVNSIENPVAKNFIGENRIMIVGKPELTRQDVVDFLSYSYMSQFRRLVDIVNYEIPADPRLEIGDTVAITSSEAGLTSNLFWVDGTSWFVSPAQFSMNVSLNPYRPQPSYEPIVEPASPSTTVDNFQFSATNGRNLDPDNFTDNYYSLSEHGSVSSTSGFYSAALADDNPPVYVKIEFDLYKSSNCTLLIRNLLTNAVVAIIAQDEFLEWGHHEFFWDGKAYNSDHTSYTHFPIDANIEYDTWRNVLQERLDPVQNNSKDLDEAGYFMIELSYNVDGDSIEKDIVVATNTSDTSKYYGKSILTFTNTSNSFTINHTKTTTAVPGDVPGGDRVECFTDTYSGFGAPAGILTQITWDNDYAKLIFGGWLDFHVFVGTSTTAMQSGDNYFVYRADIAPQSFARGSHLFEVTSTAVNPWEYRPIQGQTDLLPPPAVAYDFIWDLKNLPLIEPTNQQTLGFALTLRNGIFNTVKLKDDRIISKIWMYRDNYLDILAGMFSGALVVGGAFYFWPKIKMVNSAGKEMTYTVPEPVKIESSSYSSNKHTVLPYGAGVDNLGKIGKYRKWRDGVHDNDLTVHFTLSTNTNYAYD